MEAITAYLLNLLEVAEKELKLFRLTAARVARGLGWFAVGSLLLGIGVLLLAWTLFTAVAQLFGAVAAGLAASVLILGGGGLFLWISGRNLKS